MIRLNPDVDLCPCESGRLLRQCCLGPNGTFKTTPCITQPPRPQTGLANPRCYAGKLEDCSNALSREHFISHGILKALSQEGAVKINGFDWQADDAIQEMPTPTLAS